MDDKNNDGRRSGGAAKAVKFLVGKGFYIVLFLCLAAIGISGYVILFSENSDIDPEISGISDPGLAATVEFTGITASPGTSAPNPSGQAVGSETKIPAKATSASTAPPETAEPSEMSTSNSEKPTVEKLFYVRPVAGQTVRLYSGEVPVYNPTMGDWRIHTGIDIKADIGTEVCSVAEGVVSKIYTDDFKGVCVEIEHSDGLTSVYCGLLESVLAEVGDEVKAGTPIGGVGETALFEVLDEPHLHFEIREDGLGIDPSDVLPGNAN